MNLPMPSKSFFACALGIVVLASAAGCSHNAAGDASEEAVATVTVTKVARATITRTLAVTGTIAALPNEDAKVSSPVPGRVAKVLVAEGDHVSAGQVMAEIDPQTFRDQVRQAQGGVEQAKANLQNAIANHDREESLFQRGIASGKEVEDARTQVAVNQGGLNQAEGALSIAHQQLARTQIRSPLDGIVARHFTSGGEQVDGTAAQPVVEVANIKTVELLSNVPAGYLANIRVGLKFPVNSESVPGATFNASVVAVSPVVDPGSDVGLVRIRIANPQGLLRLGMFLTAQLPLETHPNALVVSPKAIYRGEDSQPHVYRVQGEDAEMVPVTLGIETTDTVELVSGVNEGDTVILDGGYGLPEKAKVKVKP